MCIVSDQLKVKQATKGARPGGRDRGEGEECAKGSCLKYVCQELLTVFLSQSDAGASSAKYLCTSRKCFMKYLHFF
jgi:hypothetical protein